MAEEQAPAIAINEVSTMANEDESFETERPRLLNVELKEEDANSDESKADDGKAETDLNGDASHDEPSQSEEGKEEPTTHDLLSLWW